MTHRIHRRRTGAVALVTAALATIAPIGAASANAPATHAPNAVVRIDAGSPLEHESRVFGSTEAIRIGPATTRVEFDVDTTAVDDLVVCVLSASGEWAAEQAFTAAEWAAAPAVELAPGTVVPDGRSYELDCRSGALDWAGWRDTWVLTPDESAGALVVLDDASPDSVDVRAYHGSISAAPLSLHPGDHLEIVGAAGTWEGSTASGELRAYGRASDARVTGLEGTVSADGALLQFTLPADLHPEHLSAVNWIELSSSVTGGGQDGEPGSTETRRTFWVRSATISEAPAAQPTTTRLSVSSTTAVSFQRVSATVVVSTAAGSAPTGRVAVFIDGERVASTSLTTASNGRVSVTLPRVDRGRHTVTARFEGSPLFAPSTSGNALLRILF